jgi:hypothetical protein
MKAPPTVVLELVETSPPRFRVIAVDERLICEDNLTVGELLSDSDVDFLFEAYGQYGVEVRYPD